jgi:hypothetical protein
MLASNKSPEPTSVPEDNPTVALPMSPNDEAAAQAIASALSCTSDCRAPSICLTEQNSSAYPDFLNPNSSDLLTSPVSPWDDLLATRALDGDLGMTPDMYTSPLMDFGDDFDNMPSLFGSTAFEGYETKETVGSHLSPSGLPLPDMNDMYRISPGTPVIDDPSVQLSLNEDDSFTFPTRRKSANRTMSSVLVNSNPHSHSPFSLTPVPSRIQRPPDKLHPTLSSWFKNINKLNSLINRLQELAYSAPKDHRSQLLNKVAGLRETFKKQQERCIEFLQLSEDYANKHLLDIDAEIRQQSTLLNNLEERLEAAKKLHGDAVNLQMFYESGTVASMKDLRGAKGKAVPHCLQRLQGKLLRPSIFRYFAAASLFKEVDFVMTEIRRFYEELNKFWREEICCVVEALKKRRVDPRDFERWNSFRSLKQTIGFWKV